MLTIDRPSLMNNKIMVATVVFAVGFIGSLSALRYFQPGLGQLASGRESGAASRPAGETQSNADTASSDKRNAASQDKGTVHGVTPVTPVAVDPPAVNYSGQPSPAGAVQPLGQVAPISQSPTTPSVSPPAAVTQPTGGVVTQPSVPSDSVSSLTAPVTSLKHTFDDTSGNLVPSLCACGN